jgi:hypothetical protein
MTIHPHSYVGLFCDSRGHSVSAHYFSPDEWRELVRGDCLVAWAVLCDRADGSAIETYRRDLDKPTDIAKAFQEIRAAGGSGWDEIKNVEEFLGRKPTEAEVERLRAEVARLHRIAVSDPDETRDEVKALGNATAEACRAIDVRNRASALHARNRENRELRAEVARLKAELDAIAFVAACGAVLGLYPHNNEARFLGFVEHLRETGNPSASVRALVRKAAGLGPAAKEGC